MPLAGIARRLTAMLIQLCTPNMIVMPAATKRQNGSWLREASKETAQYDEAEEDDQRHAGDHAELLAGDGEDEVGVRVGKDALVDALARPAPEPAARENALQRRVDLKGVDHAAGRVGIDEAQHALMNVRRQLVGGEAAGDAEPADADHPEPVQPGHEEQRSPDNRHQHRLSEVGLEDQRHDRQRQNDEGQRSSTNHRRRRLSPAFGEGPGGQNDESRLDEFGRLKAEDPAPRALDLRAEHQREHDQREGDRRTAAAPARRTWRGERNEVAIIRIAVGISIKACRFDEMKRRQIEPLGDGGARRERHDEADHHQRSEGTEQPPIDGPHPIGDGAAFRSRHHDYAPPPSSVERRRARNASPRASKLANWSNEAQAGDSSTTGSSASRSHRVAGRRGGRGDQRPAAFERNGAVQSLRELFGRLADQIGLGDARKERTKRLDAALFRPAAENPVDVAKRQSAFSAASALVALESLMNSTRPRRARPLPCDARGPGKDSNARAICSRSTPSTRATAQANAAFCALWAPRSARAPARSTTGSDSPRAMTRRSRTKTSASDDFRAGDRDDARRAGARLQARVDVAAECRRRRRPARFRTARQAAP